QSSLLHINEKCDERLQIPPICHFQGVDIPRPIISCYHHWKPSCFCEDEAGQCSCHTAISILVRMNLRKPMMQPRRLYFHRNLLSLVLRVQTQQPFHLGIHMLRRAILMRAAIRLLRIVRTLLVFSFCELALKEMPELVHYHGRFLMAQEPRVQFMDVALRERTVTFDELKQAFEHIGVVLNNRCDQLGRLLSGMAANEVGIDPTLDQRLCDPAIKFVYALDLSGFN